MLRGISLIVFFAFAVSSCTYMNNMLPRSSAKKTKRQKMETAGKSAQQNIARGDYEEAIRIYRSLLSEYPGDRAVNGKFNEVFEAAKDGADSEYRKKDYGSAGTLYAYLEENYPDEARLSFDQAHVREKKKLCSKMLMEEGLLEYRQGNLDRALLKWKSALKFDPENAEVKKAADTATLQLKNLKK